MTNRLRSPHTGQLDLYGLARGELIQLVAFCGYSPLQAARVWRYLYHDEVSASEVMVDLPARLRSRLSADARLVAPTIACETLSSDGQTRKLLVELADGQQVETVVMPARGRLTACLSTQAGCALGCVFCATGQMGFARNLTAAEIVGQAMLARRVVRLHAPSQRLTNIVFMGMGEPLLNYEAVMRALDILRDSAGLAIAGKRITLSTVGVIPGIVRLADERRPCSLAVSLHAATQAERLALVPSAATWPLDELMDACRYYSEQLDRRIFFEWTLIAGQNDSPQQAEQLIELLRDLPAHVNLIPLNPTAGYADGRDDAPAGDRFHAILRDAGLPATLRRRRGIEIAAGCGQLAGVMSFEPRSAPAVDSTA
jgi:23S rRNA (adenine2503-C2)-methyltransferase